MNKLIKADVWNAFHITKQAWLQVLEPPGLSSETLTHGDGQHGLIEGPSLILQDLWPVVKW